MTTYDEQPVPRGTSGRWEVVLNEIVRPGHRVGARKRVSKAIWDDLRTA